MNQWPKVSGDRVVWFGAGGTDGGDDNEIFTWTSAGGLVQITTDDVDEQGAQVSGDLVVWMGHDSSMIYQTYTWTPSGVTTKLTDEATGAFSPAISGDRIAWVNGQRVVYTWTQASGPVQVSVLENMGSKDHLRVSGDRAAYLRATNTSGRGLRRWITPSRSATPAPACSTSRGIASSGSTGMGLRTN